MAAYIIVIREKIHDPAPLDRYAQIAATAPRDQLNRLARYGHHEVVEGAGCEGVAILEFPDMAQARAWYGSPQYQEARQYRRQAGDYRVMIVEGL
ncbi:DUF1330 domain-containing protein [Sphingobium sp.]|uniref:DUF1330 domain-containing protein n=1 Tax=Sphingobium sp. TaxID=1912891 RepID=UPI003B3B42DF